MKKLSVLLVAMAVAVSASAGVNLKANRSIKSNKIMPKTEMVKSTVKVNDLKSKTQLRATIADPEGEAKTYARSGKAVYVSSGYLYTGEQTKRIDMVYGENGKVYMKNLLFGTSDNFGDYWVEGQMNEEGTEIVVPMGQSIYWSDYYQADVVLAFGQTEVLYNESGSAYLELTVDDRITEAVYSVEGDVITLQGTEGPAEFTGDLTDYEAYGLCAYWTDDNSFAGIEWNTVFTETEAPVAPTVITEIPEGCQTYTYYRNSACIYSSFFGIGETVTDGKFTVAFDLTNGDVYIQNPAWWYDYNDTWVKGTYDWMTGIITIPAGQYLSWNDAYEYGVVLGWGSSYIYVDVDENGEEGYYLGTELDERTTEIQFMIDDDCIHMLGCEGDINAEFPESYNATGLYTYWSDNQEWTSLEFTNRDEYGYAQPFGYMVNLVPAVPANPSADEWYDCGDESGYSRFYFTLPTTDVDGNMIDPEYLSFSIFVDNVENGVADPEIFHFTGDDYYFDLNEGDDYTEIEYWLYSNAVDFHDYYIYMYRTNEEGYEPLFTENIGIQVYYTVNGVRNASDIVWLYPTQTNVDELNASKTVANVRYFNVAGQEMAQPEGIAIKVTTYTDGSKSAVKIVK